MVFRAVGFFAAAGFWVVVFLVVDFAAVGFFAVVFPVAAVGFFTVDFLVAGASTSAPLAAFVDRFFSPSTDGVTRVGRPSQAGRAPIVQSTGF